MNKLIPSVPGRILSVFNCVQLLQSSIHVYSSFDLSLKNEFIVKLTADFIV